MSQGSCISLFSNHVDEMAMNVIVIAPCVKRQDPGNTLERQSYKNHATMQEV